MILLLLLWWHLILMLLLLLKPPLCSWHRTPQRRHLYRHTTMRLGFTRNQRIHVILIPRQIRRVRVPSIHRLPMPKSRITQFLRMFNPFTRHNPPTALRAYADFLPAHASHPAARARLRFAFAWVNEQGHYSAWTGGMEVVLCFADTGFACDEVEEREGANEEGHEDGDGRGDAVEVVVLDAAGEEADWDFGRGLGGSAGSG